MSQRDDTTAARAGATVEPLLAAAAPQVCDFRCEKKGGKCLRKICTGAKEIRK
jgi:hypothetical protein